MRLLDDQALEQSATAANCRMNRERNLTGRNGYSNELGFDPLDVLRQVVRAKRRASWLDLCCGSGRALLEAATLLERRQLHDVVAITGVDLVGMFVPGDSRPTCLRLYEASVSRWEPKQKFDLITCVHGLHYIGDKLRLIANAASWLQSDGRLIANLDPANFKFDDGKPANRRVIAELRRRGFEFHTRTKRLVCAGRRVVQFPLTYLGADAEAGPNYTGQPAVDSYYRPPD